MDAIKEDLDGLKLYVEQNPEMAEVFRIPENLATVTDLLVGASTYLDVTGRDRIKAATNDTVDEVIALVDSFVGYAISYMKQV